MYAPQGVEVSVGITVRGQVSNVQCICYDLIMKKHHNMTHYIFIITKYDKRPLGLIAPPVNKIN